MNTGFGLSSIALITAATSTQSHCRIDTRIGTYRPPAGTSADSSPICKSIIVFTPRSASQCIPSGVGFPPRQISGDTSPKFFTPTASLLPPVVHPAQSTVSATIAQRPATRTFGFTLRICTLNSNPSKTLPLCPTGCFATDVSVGDAADYRPNRLRPDWIKHALQFNRPIGGAQNVSFGPLFLSKSLFPLRRTFIRSGSPGPEA